MEQRIGALRQRCHPGARAPGAQILLQPGKEQNRRGERRGRKGQALAEQGHQLVIALTAIQAKYHLQDHPHGD